MKILTEFLYYELKTSFPEPRPVPDDHGQLIGPSYPFEPQASWIQRAIDQLHKRYSWNDIAYAIHNVLPSFGEYKTHDERLTAIINATGDSIERSICYALHHALDRELQSLKPAYMADGTHDKVYHAVNILSVLAQHAPAQEAIETRNARHRLGLHMLVVLRDPQNYSAGTCLQNVMRAMNNAHEDRQQLYMQARDLFE